MRTTPLEKLDAYKMPPDKRQERLADALSNLTLGELELIQRGDTPFKKALNFAIDEMKWKEGIDDEESKQKILQSDEWQWWEESFKLLKHAPKEVSIKVKQNVRESVLRDLVHGRDTTFMREQCQLWRDKYLEEN